VKRRIVEPGPGWIAWVIVPGVFAFLVVRELV
jgi:hypothetical protein